MVEPRQSPQVAHGVAAEHEPSARVGSLIRGKWRVDALLGSGGMAAVFAATHRNGQRAALKILHVHLAHENSIRDRFLREGYVTNKVGHAACVTVLDDDSTDEGAPFLVMELLEGETLRQLWRRQGRRLGVAHALQIADSVLDCLSACHAAGIIHRDLKPPNIFITTSDDIRVLDFGVAQMREAAAEKTREGTALGTPYYMSPEQAMGLVDQLDGRTDLFSVGAILHAVITGQRIHSARTDNEALILAATTPVPSIARLAPDLPVEVAALIDRALAWDRRARFADAKEMQGAVRSTLASMGFTWGGQAGPVPPRQPDSAVPSAKAMAEETLAAPEEAASEHDPRIVELRELFKHLERLLPNVRQLGWGHPATERALRTAFEAFVDVLGHRSEGIAVSVRPYSFMAFGHTVWEPSPPFDGIPYNAFDSGIRSLRIKAGITLDEFRHMLRLLALDPMRDLPPEDDLAAAFWDLGLPHLEYETADAFALGDAQEREGFYLEADELERAAAAMQSNRLEAQAMAMSVDSSALALVRLPTPMRLEEPARAALEQQLMIDSENWSVRYVDALVEGYIDADARGDASIVLGSLRASMADLVVAERLGLALEFHQAVAALLDKRASGNLGTRLRGAVTDAMFGGDTLILALQRVVDEPALLERIEPVLKMMTSHELHTMLRAMRQPLPPDLRRLLLVAAERVVPGAEAELAAAISAAEPMMVGPMLDVLKRAGTPAARKALAELTDSKDIAIRIEARILLAQSSEVLQQELAKLCDDPLLGVRIATLRAISRHKFKPALSLIVRRVQLQSFGNLIADERRELLMTLICLGAERGEAIALEMAKKSGLFSSEAREALRVTAIEALGAASSSPQAASALREIAQSRWGSTESTRAAAADAVAQIENRIALVRQQQEPAQ